MNIQIEQSFLFSSVFSVLLISSPIRKKKQMGNEETNTCYHLSYLGNNPLRFALMCKLASPPSPLERNVRESCLWIRFLFWIDPLFFFLSFLGRIIGLLPVAFPLKPSEASKDFLQPMATEKPAGKSSLLSAWAAFKALNKKAGQKKRRKRENRGFCCCFYTTHVSLLHWLFFSCVIAICCLHKSIVLFFLGRIIGGSWL